MNTTTLLSILVPLMVAVIGGLGYFRLKRGEKELIELKVNTGYFEVAQGTFELVTTQMQEQFKRMTGEMANMRTEFDSLQNELHEVTTERDRYRAENWDLQKRVTLLEERVEELSRIGDH